ncbi:FAD-dependent monooxygenase [Lacipirellula sp.]|uniref:FAD-dependent monooxygenase n=1 Tax=Lacipirellula sp. TaxID=2691419 RepID=UPI003D0A9739
MNAVTATKVLIVGAGPTGLLLAAELQRRSVACRLIDANPEPLHWDRATVVHPRSLEIFESLGIVASLLAAGVKQRRALIHSAGSVLGDIDLSICGSRYGFNIGISEEVTETILTEYLEQLGGHVQRASRLVNLEQNTDGVLATVEHNGVTEQIAAKWAVGCDGVRSVTRQLSGIELIGHDRPDPWAVFDTTIAGWPHSYEANYAYLDEPPVILTALPNQRWRVYLRPSSAESDLQADAASTLRRYLPGIVFENVSHPTRFHCHTKVASHYRSGRVFLAGDSAHVCSPSQGHGMNSGLQDAFNLAWKLALVCQGSAADSILDSYEAERRPIAEMITASGYAFEQAQSITDPAERRARDEELRAIFANPATRHHESIAEAELDIDYCTSPIVMGDRHDALAPGHRLPDTIEVRHPNGAAGLLHELAHRPGHTALVIGAGAADAAPAGQLAASLAGASFNPQLETTATLIAGSDESHPHAQLAAAAARQLGITGLTLLVIRPDGHVGLRADSDHLDAVQAYRALFQ